MRHPEHLDETSQNWQSQISRTYSFIFVATCTGRNFLDATGCGRERGRGKAPRASDRRAEHDRPEHRCVQVEVRLFADVLMLECLIRRADPVRLQLHSEPLRENA